MFTQPWEDPMAADSLAAEYERLRAEATVLAGNLCDLSLRATVYHYLFRASGGNHVFPLIAAHGALWAGGYFRRGLRLGNWLSWQYGWNPQLRRRRIQQLDDFANAFRDVNRRVCIDTYVNFRFTQRYGDHYRAIEFVPGELLDALRTVHTACRAKQRLGVPQLRAVFEAHFLHEQETVVSETIERAVAAFDWPLVRFLALRPPVGFAYLPGKQPIKFYNFADRRERVCNGMLAFDLAANVGWEHVERALADYGLLPAEFFADPIEHFRNLRRRILGGQRPVKSRPTPLDQEVERLDESHVALVH
jgi:hypothetical protein